MGKIKVVELFAGVGSQRMALRNLGIEHEVVAISEIDKFAIKSYMAIHGETLNLGDISKIKGEDVPDHDLLTYSFPCQDISVAGKQLSLKEGSNTRSSLLWECKKVIEAKKPKYLLLENVKNLVGKKHKGHFDKWLKYLENLGYKNFWKVLNAKDYGVPQNRERVFVVSVLDNSVNYEFPKPIQLYKVIKDMLEGEVDEKYYINKPFKLVQKGHQAELEIKGNEQIRRVYSTEKISPCLNTMQGGHREPKILEVAHTNDRYEQNARIYGENGISPTISARDYKDAKKILISQATKKGYIEMTIPGVCDLSYPNSKTRRGRVQDDGNICPTLTASTQDICSIDSKLRVRKLTPLECWRLMGFSDKDFYKAKEIGTSNSQLYKQAGNSIVVPVLEGIFRNIFQVQQNNNKSQVYIENNKNKFCECEQFKWTI